MNPEQFAAAVGLRGYVVVPQALRRAEVDGLRDALDRLMAEDEATYGADYLTALHERGITRNLPNRGQVWLELLENRVIHPLVEHVLGASYTLLAYNGITLLPHAPNPELDWHRDTAVPLTRVYALNCLYLLDDYTAANGATQVAPGSHGRFGPPPSPDLLEQEATHVIAAAGSALVFDSTIWHRSGVNRTAEPRRVVGNVFTALPLQPQFDFAREMDPAVAVALSPRVCRLLGVGTHPPSSVRAFLERRASRGAS